MRSKDRAGRTGGEQRQHWFAQQSSPQVGRTEAVCALLTRTRAPLRQIPAAIAALAIAAAAATRSSAEDLAQPLRYLVGETGSCA